MSVMTKNLIALPALMIASALLVATSRFEPAERTFSTSADITLDDEGAGQALVVVRLLDLAEVESREALFNNELWVRNEEARRSTDVRRLDEENSEIFRLRDGLVVPLDLNALCPSAGDCAIEVPVGFQGGKDRVEEVLAVVIVRSGVFDEGEGLGEGGTGTTFQNLEVEVEIGEL